jgi:hypothetical protein
VSSSALLPSLEPSLFVIVHIPEFRQHIQLMAEFLQEFTSMVTVSVPSPLSETPVHLMQLLPHCQLHEAVEAGAGVSGAGAGVPGFGAGVAGEVAGFGVGVGGRGVVDLHVLMSMVSWQTPDVASLQLPPEPPQQLPVPWVSVRPA